MTDLSNMINYKKPPRKKGGRPPTFSDPDKQRIFEEIRDGRANHDPECYRILQTHIMNDSTISEVQMDIDRAFEHVKGIHKRANRRSKEPVKKVKPVEEIDKELETEQDEETELLEEVTSVGDDPLTHSKDSDTLDKKSKTELEEVDLIIENIEKKKLKVTDEEHWEIFKEFGIMHLLEDYLRLYLYYAPDEELVSEDVDWGQMTIADLQGIQNKAVYKKNELEFKGLDKYQKRIKDVDNLIRRIGKELKRRKLLHKPSRTILSYEDVGIYEDDKGESTIGIHDYDSGHLETEVNVENLEKKEVTPLIKTKDVNKTIDDFFREMEGLIITPETIAEQIKKDKEEQLTKNRKQIHKGWYDTSKGKYGKNEKKKTPVMEG